MNIPPVLDRRSIAKITPADETHAVRVIATRVNNPGQFRLRCRDRQYIFERNGSLGAHVLDIPVSVWMAGIPKGPLRDNHSIAADLQPTAGNGILIHVVKIRDEQPETVVPGEGNAVESLTPILRDLLTKMKAPEVMLDAVALMEKGDAAQFREFVEKLQVEPGNPPPSAGTKNGPKTPAKSNAARQAEYRARKKAEKEANA